MDPHTNLANAIIMQAVRDYRNAQRYLKKHPRSEEAQNMIDDVEKFFRSQWYTELTDLNGEYLIRKLKEEAA